MTYNPKTASVTELRQNATRILHEVEITHEPVFILQNSKKTAVLIDEQTFEKLIEAHQLRQSGVLQEGQHEETERYFGKGKGLFGDGLAYQRKIRAEWK